MAVLPKLKSTGRRLDEPPEEVRYWTVRSEGSVEKRDGLEPLDGVRLTIVGAEHEAEAREVVELIEAQHAQHYGDKPWKATGVEPNVEHDVEQP